MINILAAKYFVLILLFTAILVSCNSNPNQEVKTETNNRNRVLSTDNLTSQEYTINAERDTVIKGKSGTILRIYKNTFITDNGKPAIRDVEIELREAFMPADILLSGLTTTSNGQFLETGGMLYINASLGRRTTT